MPLIINTAELVTLVGIMKIILGVGTFLAFVCVAAYSCPLGGGFAIKYNDLDFGSFFMFTMVTGWIWCTLTLVVFAFFLQKVVTTVPLFYTVQFLFSCLWFFLSILASTLFVDDNYKPIKNSGCGNTGSFLFGSGLGVAVALLWFVDAVVLYKKKEIQLQFSRTTSSTSQSTTTTHHADGSTTTTTTTVKQSSTALPF